jgi:hypothetical protein
MSPEGDDFIQLQRQWYAKLKRSGFVDAESDRGILKDWPGKRLMRDYTPQRFKEKQEYYRFASQLIWEHKFQNKLEQNIWYLHCDGYSLREISEELRTPKNKLNFCKVRIILAPLRRLVYKMVANAEE